VQSKFLSTVMKRAENWLYKGSWQCDYCQDGRSASEAGPFNGTVPLVGRSVSPLWYRAPTGAYEYVLNTAVIGLDLEPSLTTVSICLLSEITRTYTVLLRI
jgi:hypothetical protein